MRAPQTKLLKAQNGWGASKTYNTSIQSVNCQNVESFHSDFFFSGGSFFPFFSFTSQCTSRCRSAKRRKQFPRRLPICLALCRVNNGTLWISRCFVRFHGIDKIKLMVDYVIIHVSKPRTKILDLWFMNKSTWALSSTNKIPYFITKIRNKVFNLPQLGWSQKWNEKQITFYGQRLEAAAAVWRRKAKIEFSENEFSFFCYRAAAASSFDRFHFLQNRSMNLFLTCCRLTGTRDRVLFEAMVAAVHTQPHTDTRKFCFDRSTHLTCAMCVEHRVMSCRDTTRRESEYSFALFFYFYDTRGLTVCINLFRVFLLDCEQLPLCAFIYWIFFSFIVFSGSFVRLLFWLNWIPFSGCTRITQVNAGGQRVRNKGKS